MLRSYLDIVGDHDDPMEASRVPILHVRYRQMGIGDEILALAGGHPPSLAALLLGTMSPQDLALLAEFAILTEIWVLDDVDGQSREEALAGPTPRELAADGDPRVKNGAMCLLVWNGGYSYTTAREAVGDDGRISWTIDEIKSGEAVSPPMQVLVGLGDRLAP